MKNLKYLCIVLIMVLTAACGKDAAVPTPNSDEITTIITPKPTATPLFSDESEETNQNSTDSNTVVPDNTDPNVIDPNETDSNDADPAEPDPTEPDPADSDTDDPLPEETIDPNSFYQLELDNKGREFTLNDEEQEIYEQFTESLDIGVFKDVDPVSIAKIHLQCGLDGLWEAEFAMFAEESLEMTKQQFHEMHVIDLLASDISSRKIYADVVFANLEDGVFNEIGDNRSEITFEQFNGEEAKFRLIMNDDGIWQVKYNPIWDWDETLQQWEESQIIVE